MKDAKYSIDRIGSQEVEVFPKQANQAMKLQNKSSK